MKEEPMTRDQFLKASRQVSLYGNLLIWFVGSVVVITESTLVLWSGPIISSFGQVIRNRFQNEGVVGLIGGLVGGVVFAPFLLIPLLPLLWVDRRFGLRCPGCKRSVTLRCEHGKVLRTGRCCLCQELLFQD
jgi:hypothetical protein